MTPFVFNCKHAKLAAMNGYSEIGAIYFAIADKTSVARYLKPVQGTGSERMVTETYLGDPPYSYITGRMPRILRQYHAAEHQVYNSFKQKIRKVPAQASLSEIAKHVPSLEEVKQCQSHSLFCGSTICVSSAILLLGAATPNLFGLHNTNLSFMSLWLAATITLAYLVSVYLQQRFYLAKPNDKQLELGLAALREVLKNGK